MYFEAGKFYYEREVSYMIIWFWLYKYRSIFRNCVYEEEYFGRGYIKLRIFGKVRGIVWELRWVLFGVFKFFL